jgi:predicted RNase H-like nuclease (RuvC/YqgF family)
MHKEQVRPFQDMVLDFLRTPIQEVVEIDMHENQRKRSYNEAENTNLRFELELKTINQVEKLQKQIADLIDDLRGADSEIRRLRDIVDSLRDNE